MSTTKCNEEGRRNSQIIAFSIVTKCILQRNELKKYKDVLKKQLKISEVLEAMENDYHSVAKQGDFKWERLEYI